MNRLILIFSIIVICSCPCLAQAENGSYGVLIDNSGSLRTQLAFEKSLGRELVKRIVEHKGYVRIVQFDTKGAQTTEVRVSPTWSRGGDELLTHVTSLETVPGQTKLIDALHQAAEIILKQPPDGVSGPSNRMLIAITDGEDRASKTRPDELIIFLKENGIKVYAVGLLDSLIKERGFMAHSPRQKASDFLKNLTKETGGRLVLPSEKQTAVDVVTELFEGKAEKSK